MGKTAETPETVVTKTATVATAPETQPVQRPIHSPTPFRRDTLNEPTQHVTSKSV